MIAVGSRTTATDGRSDPAPSAAQGGITLRAEPRRLSPLLPDDVLTALLACRGPASRRSLEAHARIFLTPRKVAEGLRRLEETTRAFGDGSRWKLTKAGRRSRLAAAVLDSRSTWGRTRETILPMAALGLALTPGGIQRFRSGAHLRAATLTVLFGLPLSADDVRLSEVRECMLARGLAARFPDVAMPAVTGQHKFDAFSTALLRGFAGLRAGGAIDALNQLAAEAVGAADGSLTALRTAVVRAALDRGAAAAPVTDGVAPGATARPPDDGAASPALVGGSAPPVAPPGTAPPTAEIASFAGRVQALADARSTAPFADRLAIATAYDCYGRVHPDAGSLASFKERIVAAHRARRLMLRRLDYIDAIDDELRERSEVEIDGRQFHFVARDS